jgi:beta-N-acetylglucosaminidase
MKLSLTALLIITTVSLTAISLRDYDAKVPGFPYYSGEIFPKAQKAIYNNSFIELQNTCILPGKGLDKSNIIVDYISDRIKESGGKVTIINNIKDAEGVVISIGNNGLCKTSPPEKAQSYIIKVIEKSGKKVICLKGNDLQGNLWAASSFCQLVKTEKGQAYFRDSEITDWPDIANRGSIITPVVGNKLLLNWIIACKINTISFNGLWRPLYRQTWRNGPSALQKKLIKNLGKTLSPLGIKWYASIAPMGKVGKNNYILSCSSEKDFKVIYDYAMLVAKNNGGVYLALDDFRFPLSAADKKKFGTAREADMYFVNRLYTSVKKQYPNFELIFCPPFYWGPDSGHIYPESREKYLKTLGERLDPTIRIYWTGPKVKSRKITTKQLEWITALIKRKPLIWQNGKDSNHPYYYCYITDEYSCWSKWNDKDFYKNVDAYLFNSNGSMDCPTIATLADFLWNQKAYNPAESTRDMVSMMFGPKAYPLYAELNKHQSKLDIYNFKASPGAGRNIKQIKKDMKEIDSAYQKAYDYNPKAMQIHGGMERIYKLTKKFIKNVESNPQFGSSNKTEEACRKKAIKENGFDKNNDVFISAFSLTGGQRPRMYEYFSKRKKIALEKRLSTWINGKKTLYHSLKTIFTVNPFPPSGDYKLLITGANDDSLEPCKIKISINNEVIFEGLSPFNGQKWSTKEFTIPAKILTRETNFKIENIEESDNRSGPPFLLVSYVILRKTTK